MLVGIKWAAIAVNLGGTAGIPSRPIVDGSFVFNVYHKDTESTKFFSVDTKRIFVSFVPLW